MDRETNLEGLPEASSQAETAASTMAENTTHHPVTVGGLLPEVWAGLFRQQQHLLDPVLPWLHQRLVGIYWDQWWLVESAESSILNGLCVHGPVIKILIRKLQHFLQEHTEPLVHSIVKLIECWCSERARKLLHSHTARDEDDNSEATSISSRDPSHLQSVPIRAEQMQPQEEPGQEVATGPTGQDSNSTPSTSGQDRNHLPWRLRCPPKKRVLGPLTTHQPSKKRCQ
ncbi:hypothetical protein WISP_37678 [Willisornis vidua]|uniref:Uncharacterized protein n=1 Tax=Willisornis vidua TaxID=1566151 RepID=A0ABQ9DIN3_9PASS|nr:hypothetical protein WISP_37678 [Willisornis vidua]